jgi:general secretion pathway protein F
MPDFEVRVHEPGNHARTRRVAAASAQQAVASLGVPPGRVLSIKRIGTGTTSARPPRVTLSLRLLSQELAVLLDAGIPLLEALSTLREKEQRPAVTACLGQLHQALLDGQSLSDALAKHPATFDELFVAIVRANERSGSLATALHEHARYRAWAEALRDKVVGALIYPALLLAVGSVVIGFLLLFVLPRFAGVLEGSLQDLPWASRWLFDLGVACAAHPGVGLAALAALTSAAILAVRNPTVHVQVVSTLWRLPVLGGQLRVLALAGTYRAMALLLAAGIPAVTAMRLATAIIALPLRPALQRATERVAEGARLSDAWDAAQLATPVAQRMLRVGERSGELAQMFARAAAFHDDELSRLTDWVTRALNPILMLFMGLVVGGIVVLMYLPIFQLVEQVQ